MYNSYPGNDINHPSIPEGFCVFPPSQQLLMKITTILTVL